MVSRLGGVEAAPLVKGLLNGMFGWFDGNWLKRRDV